MENCNQNQYVVIAFPIISDISIPVHNSLNEHKYTNIKSGKQLQSQNLTKIKLHNTFNSQGTKQNVCSNKTWFLTSSQVACITC